MYLARNFRTTVTLSILVLMLATSALAEVPGRTLLVVAHPDDEYYFAATVYRMAVQLQGEVDELIITNGEGGYKVLTRESIGRKELPSIRRKEALQAGKVLGIRQHFFLNQKDTNFTTDESDGQRNGWDLPLITTTIAKLVSHQRYRYIFCILPRPTTHGHHQEAAALALNAISGIAPANRPVLLGFDTDPQSLAGRQGWPSAYSYAFDRTAAFGFHGSLSYQIVVNWMIAEHKSQGLLQTMCGRDPKEYIWVDADASPVSHSAADSLFRQLNLPVTDRKGSR
jgi:N-acetylglucosamine malate deacetylase 2